VTSFFASLFRASVIRLKSDRRLREFHRQGVRNLRADFGGLKGITTAAMKVTVVAVEDADLYVASAALVAVTCTFPRSSRLTDPPEIVHPAVPGSVTL